MKSWKIQGTLIAKVNKLMNNIKNKIKRLKTLAMENRTFLIKATTFSVTLIFTVIIFWVTIYRLLFSELDLNLLVKDIPGLLMLFTAFFLIICGFLVLDVLDKEIIIFNKDLNIEQERKEKELKKLLFFFLISISIIDFLFFILLYNFKNYKAPVGWDTAFYLESMRIINDKGVIYFIEESNYIHFYILLLHSISHFFFISPPLTVKIIPIIMGIIFALINFSIVKNISKSSKIAFLAFLLSLISINILRLVRDLHRNLFALILVEIALFILLPKILKQYSHRNITILIILLTIGGLSQIETFSLAIFILFLLLIFSIWSQPFEKTKIITYSIIIPCLLVFMFIFPFLIDFTSSHITLSSETGFSYKFAAEPEDYLKFLGGPLLPFYFLGLGFCLSYYLKNKEEILPLVIFLWNAVLIIASFLLPRFHVKVWVWRILLLSTVPVLAPIGIVIFLNIIKRQYNSIKRLNKLNTRKILKNKEEAISAFILILTVTSASFWYIGAVSSYFNTHISNEAYENLNWLSNQIEKDKPSIFLLYLNHGKFTEADTKLYQQWINAIVSLNSYVYFGIVNFLLYSIRTPFEDPFLNETSYEFWNILKDNNLTNNLDKYPTYVISDWYPEELINTSLFLEIKQGMYTLKSEFFDHPYTVPILYRASEEFYNKTENIKLEKTNWSINEWILTVSKTSTSDSFQISYIFPMSNQTNYTLKIRLFDYNESYSPITIRLDSTNITTINYNNTLSPKIIEITLPNVDTNTHFIHIETTNNQKKPPMISLDYLELLPQTIF